VPVYEQSYRSYDGEVRLKFRWWEIVKQELRIQFKSRPFVYLIVVAMLHFFLRLSQVIAYDVLMSNPNHPVTLALRQVPGIAVSARTFFDFIRIQAPFVFLISMYAGCGMICNDFRDNLMEVYFSKPLTWRDYVLGKSMTLGIIGLGMTAAPALVLLILHNLLAPGLKTLQATWWIPFSIIAFSLIVVAPCTLAVLASSSMLNSERFAGISVFMVLFADLTAGTMLQEMLHERNYMIIAFPMAMNRVGEVLFRDRRVLFPMPWGWSALFIAVVCLGALWIVCAKVRRAEIPV
jgi:ABC-type transport system involved in multi-copper enzyme maturation permease subunit